MRIVFIGNGTIWADTYPNPTMGGSVQTWELSKELARRGHEVFIIRRSHIRKRIVNNVILLGVNIKGIDNCTPPFSYLYHSGMVASKLLFSNESLRNASRINADIICFTDRLTATFPLYLRMPKVYIMHAPDALDFYKSYSIRANKLNSIRFSFDKFVEGCVLSNVDGIVTLNNFIARYLKDIGYRNVYKIPNGVDCVNFSNNGDENFILYAGRFDWNKNVCSLVNVFAQIRKSYPSYRLYLVGSGPEEKKIMNLVKEKGVHSSVKIIPWLPRNKLMELMSRCSIFVLPSFFEVSPVVILEAMASAKPVVARANMGTVDIVIHGENGYLYNNNEELREYLEKLLSDDNLRGKIGRNARRVVEREYTFSKIANKYEELFYALIKSYKNG